jgi:pyrimidine operon attenuation protein/uracil phosphoribosyltransferase
MKSSNTDIEIEQGTKWEQEILIDPDEYSLLNKEVLLSIKNVSTLNTTQIFSEISENISVNITTGLVDITLFTEDTLGMTKHGIYKLEFIEDSEVDRFLRGKVIVIPDPLEVD